MTVNNIHTLIWACFITAIVVVLVLGSVLNHLISAKHQKPCDCACYCEADEEPEE
jgi:hypothetical protein